MFTYRLTTTNPDCPIKSMKVDASAYGYGYIVIQLKPNLTSNSILADLQEWMHKEAVVSIPISNIFLSIQDSRHLISLYEMLVVKGHIVDADRANCVAIVREIDKLKTQRSSVTNSATEGQHEILLSVASIYMDDLIESSQNPTIAVKLFAAALAPFFDKYRNALATLLQMHNIDSSTLDSLESLWKICHGLANLETTYSRLAGKIPSLIAQRLAILEYAISKLLEKYPNLSDQEQLYIVMGILLFKSENQTLSPVEDTKQLINESLRRQMLPSNISQYFENTDIMVLTTRAFKYMGIIREQGPDFDRIEVLQRNFNSEALANYISEIKASIQAKVNPDPLLIALQDNNHLEVHRILEEQRHRINEFIVHGQTPLIYALQSCNDDVVRAVLSLNPDINKSNQFNTFRPLGVPINFKRAKLTAELLQRGANPFVACGILAPTKREFHETASSPFKPGNAIMIACSHYQHTSSDDLAESIFALLDAGACLGYTFPKEIQLPRKPAIIVAIGGSFPEDKETVVVTTIEQFVQYIPVSDYSTWIQRFEQFKQTLQPLMLNQKDLEVLSTCDRILKHMKKVDLMQVLPSTTTSTASTASSMQALPHSTRSNTEWVRCDVKFNLTLPNSQVIEPSLMRPGYSGNSRPSMSSSIRSQEPMSFWHQTNAFKAPIYPTQHPGASFGRSQHHDEPFISRPFNNSSAAFDHFNSHSMQTESEDDPLALAEPIPYRLAQQLILDALTNTDYFYKNIKICHNRSAGIRMTVFLYHITLYTRSNENGIIEKLRSTLSAANVKLSGEIICTSKPTDETDNIELSKRPYKIQYGYNAVTLINLALDFVLPEEACSNILNIINIGRDALGRRTSVTDGSAAQPIFRIPFKFSPTVAFHSTTSVHEPETTKRTYEPQSGREFRLLTTSQRDRIIKYRNRLLAETQSLNQSSELQVVITALENKEYNKALRNACNKGNLGIVQKLIDYNDRADLNLDFNEGSSSNGNTPLDYAINSGNEELMALLRRHGAKSKNDKVLSR